MKIKRFVPFLLASCIALGAYWGLRARSESFPFVSLHELVPAEEIEWKCEGEVVALRERVLDQEGVSRSVDCGDMRTVFAPSLVGQPTWGYSASAELASPRRGFSYSLWVYGDPAEAAQAGARWQGHFRGLAREEIAVSEEGAAFTVQGEDEAGLPLWGRVVQKGSRLLVIRVRAMPLPLTPKDAEQWKAQGLTPLSAQLEPEDGEATEAFFERVIPAIEERFLIGEK